MKKFILGLSLTLLTGTVFAQWHHGHHHGHYRGNNWGWVAPVIIGGVIGYELAQPRPVVVQQPPVIINDPNLVVINGIVYRKVTMDVNGVLQEVLVKQ